MTKRHFFQILTVLIGLFYLGSLNAEGLKEDPEDINQIEDFVRLENRKFKDLKRSRLHSTKNGKSAYAYKYPDEDIQHPLFGFLPNPTTVHHALRTEDEIIFNVKNNFDKYSRRVNTESINDRTEFVMLFGCSYLYGYGVEDHQAIHSYLSLFQSKYFAYNYAVGGTGTNTVLSLLQNRNFSEEIPLSTGHAYYIFIEDHVFRANGFAQQRTWLKDTAYFEKENDKMVYRGSFEKAQPFTTWFYRLLDEHLGLTRLLSVNFPKERDSHFIYTCDLIEGSKKAFKKRYPKGVFTVYQHPLGGQIHPTLRKCLKERRVRTLTSKIEAKDRYRIAFDGHPTAEVNQMVAQEIAQDLLNLEN